MSLPTEVEFIKCSPTKNMTLLVKTLVPERHQYDVGKMLIAYGHIAGEQCGFLVVPKNKKADYALRMMAGEFCGNATISLGAYAMKERFPKAKTGDMQTFLMEVSGAEALLFCTMEKMEMGYVGTIAMPLPQKIANEEFLFDGKKYTYPVVHFLGISHIVIEQETLQESTMEAMANAWQTHKTLGEAFGIMHWNRKEQKLIPYVYLKGFGGIFEWGCGSGTSAVAIYEALRQQKTVTTFCEQKGGTMSAFVELDEKQSPKKIILKGGVSIVAEGTAFLL